MTRPRSIANSRSSPHRDRVRPAAPPRLVLRAGAASINLFHVAAFGVRLYPCGMGNPILRYIEYIIVYACNIRKYTSIYIKGFFCASCTHRLVEKVVHNQKRK